MTWRRPDGTPNAEALRAFRLGWMRQCVTLALANAAAWAKRPDAERKHPRREAAYLRATLEQLRLDFEKVNRSDDALIAWLETPITSAPAAPEGPPT